MIVCVSDRCDAMQSTAITQSSLSHRSVITQSSVSHRAAIGQSSVSHQRGASSSSGSHQETEGPVAHTEGGAFWCRWEGIRGARPPTDNTLSQSSASHHPGVNQTSVVHLSATSQPSGAVRFEGDGGRSLQSAVGFVGAQRCPVWAPRAQGARVRGACGVGI